MNTKWRTVVWWWIGLTAMASLAMAQTVNQKTVLPGTYQFTPLFCADDGHLVSKSGIVITQVIVAPPVTDPPTASPLVNDIGDACPAKGAYTVGAMDIDLVTADLSNPNGHMSLTHLARVASANTAPALVPGPPGERGSTGPVGPVGPAGGVVTAEFSASQVVAPVTLVAATPMLILPALPSGRMQYSISLVSEKAGLLTLVAGGGVGCAVGKHELTTPMYISTTVPTSWPVRSLKAGEGLCVSASVAMRIHGAATWAILP